MAGDKDEAWKKIKDGAKAAMDMAGKTAQEWKDQAAETAKTLSEPGQTPKKKAAYKKIGMAVALLLVIILLASFLSGPSLSCDDSEVKGMVGELVKENVQKLANNISELGMIFEDPATSELRDLIPQLKNMRVSIDNVKEVSMNSKAKRCSCTAEATLVLGNLKDTQPVRYQVSDTDKGIYVELDPVSLFSK